MVQRRYAASGPAAIRWERCNVDTLLGVRGLALGDGVLISQHKAGVPGCLQGGILCFLAQKKGREGVFPSLPLVGTTDLVDPLWLGFAEFC